MLIPDLVRRSQTPELMDTETVSYEDFRRCLADLAIVNRLTLAHRPTLAWLKRAAARHPTGKALHIVDVGSGYGDMLRLVARWAERSGIAVKLTGIDLNPWSERAAREAGSLHVGIEYLTSDAFDYHPSPAPDIVISSLFAHHLADEALIRFLRWMHGIARRGWFINDLRRSAIAYGLFGAGTSVGGWHRFIRHDGLISITRAFREDDWLRLLEEAGIRADEVEIGRWFPYRLCVGAVR